MAQKYESKSNRDCGEIRQEKVSYTTPKLRKYGTVRQLTSGGVGTKMDSGQPNTMVQSDRRLKENIVQIGTHWLGIGLYLFNYKSEYRKKYGQDRHLGVMADEVGAVMPAAVSTHPDGYKTVNYAMLGISRID